MACLISLSSSFYSLRKEPQTLIQGTSAWKLAERRLRSPISSTKEIQLHWSNCSNRGIFVVNRSSFFMVPLSRSFCLQTSNNLVVSSNSDVMISGFWVGPDIDDGWGFVEALIQRIQ